MTVLTYVTQGEMERRTGFKKALGYAFPKQDEILIRKGLPEDLEKKVKAHEEEHILKGEEGPGLFSKIGKIFGGKSKKKNARKARRKGVESAEAQRKAIEAATDEARADQSPYRQAGATALDALMSMTGLGRTNFGAVEAGREAEDARVTGAEYLDIFRDKLGRKGKKRLDQYMATRPYDSSFDDQEYIEGAYGVLGKRGKRRLNRFQKQTPYGRAYGGVIGRAYGGPYGRAYGGFMNGKVATAMLERTSPVQYNVNELGPENVFEGGEVTRNPNPQTIEPSDTGYVQPNENPGGVEGGFNFQTDPGYDFRFNEGMRGLERGAAARGGVLSGGFGRKAIRYGQDYASNEYSRVYDRIARIAGIGSSAAGQSGVFSMQGGAGVAGAEGNKGFYNASGYMAQGNAQDAITGAYGGVLDHFSDSAKGAFGRAFG